MSAGSRRRPVSLRWRHLAPPDARRLPLRPACPPGCTTDHSGTIGLDEGIVAHYRTVAEVAGCRVDVVVVDDLDSGERTEPAIEALLTDAIGPAEARALALALLDAVDIVEGATT